VADRTSPIYINVGMLQNWGRKDAKNINGLANLTDRQGH